jgi:hypothetical protein
MWMLALQPALLMLFASSSPLIMPQEFALCVRHYPHLLAIPSKSWSNMLFLAGSYELLIVFCCNDCYLIDKA